MVLKDADLILAVGREIRITSLGDSKLNRNAQRSYKTLHTPNIQFDIHQVALNPSGKLLAVAGAFQVAVVVLPRPGFTRLVPSTVDCKSIQVGQYYHAAETSAPIAKIEWHPWGEAGSTLMVMTTDGKLREYDISVDTDEPQQILSFTAEKKSRSFHAEDAADREVASFTLGKGKADWGPLTVYAVMRSGDVYSICPYMPQNASIPSSYVHALECFIAAKQEFLSQDTSTESRSLSVLYDYQRKYINALLKQLPPGTVSPEISRPVLVHPPTTMKTRPLRQGPFLLQPSPRSLDGSEGGDATDIAYLAFGDAYDDDNEGETERLGVVIIAFQDGKVDVCLDVEKVEARWDNREVSSQDLPMLAVYETVDLGLVSMLSALPSPKGQPPMLDLLQGNHPVFHADPIHDDVIYLYHGFGVHALHLGPVLQGLGSALHADDDPDDTSLQAALQKTGGTIVQHILTTFSVERRCSNPVVAVSVPNDVYLTYSIFILTSAMRITSFPLRLQSDSPLLTPKNLPSSTDEKSPLPLIPRIEGPPAYVSLLEKEPYTPSPTFSRPVGLSRDLVAPKSSGPFMLTAETMRYLGTAVEQLSSQIHNIQLAHRDAEIRAALQQQEFQRQRKTAHDMVGIIESLRGPRHTSTEARLSQVQTTQKTLLARLDRILQGLMQKASPELSEYETKWFDELRRMKQEVTGMGRYDEGSLAGRTSMLQREYARLLPRLQEVMDKENERKRKLLDGNQGLGFSQAFELGERSNDERARIADLEREILKLAAKLDISVGKPPSQRDTQGEMERSTNDSSQRRRLKSDPKVA
ncbi:hypothetical protein PLICRDRAFT_47645 [Plicaturopsis crispa FD-325 SS-3]|nr:hypothetical protein PLICRDRAFT_47645 [Plicaturopsis crispa FD-325 SS-3]